MVINIDNGYTLDLRAIKSMLLTIFENNPNFPIDNKETLIKALGGNNQLLFVNETMGDLPASVLAENILKNIDTIDEPNQIVDGIIGDSFVNIITKFKLLDTIYDLNYPIESKDIFINKTKGLMIFGIPIETIAEKLDYPIDKSDQIINRIKLIDRKLLEVNVDLIANIKESEVTAEGEEVSEALSDTDEKTLEDLKTGELSLKERIKQIIHEGKDAYRDKNYQKALEIYEKGLSFDPENTELNFLKKSMEQRIKDMNKPEEKPSTVESEVPEPAEDLEPKETETIEPPIEPSTEPESVSETPSESEPEELEKSTSASLDVLQSAQKDLESEMLGEESSSKSEKETEKDFNKIEMDSKIEELGKRLQEKVSILKNLTAPADLPEDACKSCEGTGKCYWCKGSGECKTCTGSGKDDSGSDCPDCKGTGKCHSCNSDGDCHWCNGTGKKKS
jgi:hypothetical protein